MKITTVCFFIVFIIFANLLPTPVSAQKNQSVILAQTKTAGRKIPETAAPSSIEQVVLEEINTARTEPQKYIKYLEDYKKLFKGSIVFLPNYLQVETSEGTAPVDEAIEYLKQVPKLNSYKFSDGLNQISRVQLTDLMEDSMLGHKGKDGSDLAQRLARVGRFGSLYAENISHYSEVPRQIVMMMIVDDGVKARSHRKNIFSPAFGVVGISFGKGKVGQGLCVVDFADTFFEDKPKSGMPEFR